MIALTTLLGAIVQVPGGSVQSIATGGGVNDNLFVVIAVSAIFYGTPLLLAALGEMLTERSGILNLGVEGEMLMGAVAAAWTAIHASGPGWLVVLQALLAAMVAGGLAALLHAVLVITFRVEQIVSGLAITILAGAAGLSSYLASTWDLASGPVPHRLELLDVGGLGSTPIVGPLLFSQNVLTYFSWALVVFLWWYLFRSRAGLHLRAVGESPATADAMGINVNRYRYVHTVVGGTLAGLGGAFFPLAIIPLWSDGVTGGRGWIALALVIFGFWRPDLILVGAYLFGAFSSLGLTLQARNVQVSPQLLDSLPYLMTIVVLVFVSTGWARRRLGAPAALGTAYEREER
ncbi:ABC transporter permease [Aquihabitans sp. McL0605]|uniref:ABC transporter permease n=1 Tax=Aquihabitans sp. McL0605 TaxID=3415671 RepID=UPI003CFA9DB6